MGIGNLAVLNIGQLWGKQRKNPLEIRRNENDFSGIMLRQKVLLSGCNISERIGLGR